MAGVKRRISTPKNWKDLPYYAPYYLNSIAPDRLQIWVKPRYWFPVFIILLSIAWLFPSLGSYDTFDAVWGPVISVFAGENAKSKITDAYNLRFLLMVPFGFLVGIALRSYKRHGLIEIAPEGIWIVDNPKFSPGEAQLIERAHIMGFDDHDLYTSTGKFSRVRSGTELRVVMHPGKGADTDLVKIWGVDSFNMQDYHAIRDAIEKAFAAGKKSKPLRKPGESFGDPVPGPTAAELRQQAERREKYLRWEKIYLIASPILFVVQFAYCSLVPLGYQLHKHWWLYVLVLGGCLFQATWFFRLWRQPVKWRTLLVLPTAVIASCAAIYASYLFRDSQMRQGVSLYGTVTDVSEGKWDYEVGFKYVYQGKEYQGKGMIGLRPELGGKVKVQVSQTFPRMHEIHGLYWTQPRKNRKPKQD